MSGLKCRRYLRAMPPEGTYIYKALVPSERLRRYSLYQSKVLAASRSSYRCSSSPCTDRTGAGSAPKPKNPPELLMLVLIPSKLKSVIGMLVCARIEAVINNSKAAGIL